MNGHTLEVDGFWWTLENVGRSSNVSATAPAKINQTLYRCLSADGRTRLITVFDFEDASSELLSRKVREALDR